jgi:hypothetical protein
LLKFQRYSWFILLTHHTVMRTIYSITTQSLEKTMKVDSADNLTTAASESARTKHGLLVAQMEVSFINQTISSMHGLKAIAQRALHPSTAQGVQAALNVFYRTIDAKLAVLQQSVQGSENAWNELLVVRRQAAANPAKDFSQDFGFFGFGKTKARLSELSDSNADQADLLRRLVDATGAYMSAQSQVTQIRSEIASLLNGASLFLTEQVSARGGINQEIAAANAAHVQATTDQEKERLTVVPPPAAAFQYQPPVGMVREAVG